MKRDLRRTLTFSLSLFALVAAGLRATAQQWTPPTDEELKMTSQPEVPGAAAVELFHEEITDDHLHYWSKYVRLKVLNERGKDYANVELKQYSSDEGTYESGYTITDIQGRTIHPDGTIIPFTGKPYEKVIEKRQGYKETAKVFTLPDVEVGSIIEYRYSLRYADNLYIPPQWFVQSELFTRKAHYFWQPTDQILVSKDENGEELTSSISWTPVLPKEFTVKQTNRADGKIIFDLNVHDIPPIPDEEFMPPFRSLTYRVLFYYTAFRSSDDYWKAEGKRWARQNDRFIGPDSKVKEAVAGLVAPSDTDEQKLRKIYAAVMQLDNTSYSRQRTAEEGGPAKSADDIWERKRGGDDDIARLFVAMARAAGMKAYVMAVVNRDHNMFFPSFTNFSQFDDLVAIVNVGGKEQFFDPGTRYCPYGHLQWSHTIAGGVRQTDGGSAFAQTPDEPYSYSRTQRIADLKLDEQGVASGTVRMTWTGAPALAWRTQYLRGDQTGLQHNLHDMLERLLPGGMDVQVGTIDNLDQYEQPLAASFQVKGAIGSTAGKRLLVPGDVFEANSKPLFPHEKRETPIAFDYSHIVQDAMRITYPPTIALESAPAAGKVPFQNYAIYSMDTQTAPNSVTVHRNFEIGNLFYKVDEYPALRAFYSQFETKDQEPIVLKAAAVSSASAGQ